MAILAVLNTDLVDIPDILWPQKHGTQFVFRVSKILDRTSDIVAASVQSSKEGVQQGALSGPARAHDCEHLTSLSDPTHPVQNLLTLSRSTECCYCHLRVKFIADKWACGLVVTVFN